MSRQQQTEALIVGAGPVGLLAAMLLAEKGLRVKIIDQEAELATRSYACALHPSSLRILGRLGFADHLIGLGHKIETIAIYEGPNRAAEIHLPELSLEYPFVLAIPQNVLEAALAEFLFTYWGIQIDWKYHWSGARFDGANVVSTVSELFETAKGYIVPGLDWEVKRTFETQSSLLIGADGCDSLVRRSLKIPYDKFSPPESFLVCEFDSESDPIQEIRIVLNPNRVDVLWPLGINHYRWTFQLPSEALLEEHPEKERSPFIVVQNAHSTDVWPSFEKLVMERAPWFNMEIEAFDWSAQVQFTNCLAASYGVGRCWITGEAAHQTGPVGMQNMNQSFSELEQMCGLWTSLVKENRSEPELKGLSEILRSRWLKTFSDASRRSTGKASGQHLDARLRRCLPASGDDLDSILAGLSAQATSR